MLTAGAQNGGPAVAEAGPAPSPEQLVERVERLSAALEQLPDQSARERAEELVGAVVELYGIGLERIFALLAEHPDADALGDRLAGDGVVASLMLIHDLYPVSLEDRVMQALDGVRPYMESHGGNVELLGIEEGVARIRLEGSCDGCPASASTLELAIKSALDEAAPDLEGLLVEGAVSAPAPGATSGFELPVIQATPAAAGPPSWYDLVGVGGLGEGELVAANVGSVALVAARVEGSLLAFRDVCADCGGALAEGRLSEGTLACPGCGRRYFLPRAGRSLDDDRLLLEPVPLLEGASGARVALPG